VSAIEARYGHIYRVCLEPDVTVLGVIVSNDRLNSIYDEYITAQVATSKEHDGTAGSVRLKSGDPVFGYVICRDVGMVLHEELVEDLGPVSLETRVEVERTLRQVLGP
jgi:mRNA-degrading endonuclease toxin of MazEF toxin-antitoxin module